MRTDFQPRQLIQAAVLLYLIATAAIGTPCVLAADAETLYQQSRQAYTEKNIERSFQLTMQCAQMGHGGCMSNLSDFYREGKVAPQDLKLALEWAIRTHGTGTQYGHGGSTGAYNAGRHYLYGWGVERNADTALEWLGRAEMLLERVLSERDYSAQTAHILRANLAYEYGNAFLQKRDAAKALLYAERAVREWQMAEPIPGKRSFAYLLRGRAQYLSGNYQKAKADMDEALRELPSNDQARRLRAGTLLLLGDWTAAANDYGGLLRLRPKDRDIQLGLHVACLRSGQSLPAPPPPAKTDARDAWYGELVELLRGMRSPDQILEQTQVSDEKKRSERECEAYFYIGQTMLAKGDSTRGLEMLERSVATGVERFLEHRAAKAEIERLKVSK